MAVFIDQSPNYKIRI